MTTTQDRNEIPDYGAAAYWDHRYAQDPDAAFDWLQSYHDMKPLLARYMNQESEILVLGCGNSRLSEELYDEGFVNVTSIDVSSVVIQQLAERYADRVEMEFMVMDASRMEFPDDCFDVVLDKATLDTLLCGESNASRATHALREVYRCMKSRGVYICVSFGAPETRHPHLQADLDWNVDVLTLPKPAISGLNSEQGAVHYVYICTKP